MGVQADIAYTLEARQQVQAVAFGGNRTSGSIDTAAALRAKGGSGRMGLETDTLIAFQTKGSNLDIGDISGTIGTNADRASGSAPMIAFSCKDHGADACEDLAPTMRAMGHNESHANAGGQLAVAFALRGREGGAMPELEGDTAGALRAASGGSSRSYVASCGVRRLLPIECEKLQGFPRDYTRIPWRGKPASECPDGPRYKALGNSFAVPVIRWIGERIAAVEAVERNLETKNA
jgi:DNA (cytosine-5)-methyltransferase 1